MAKKLFVGSLAYSVTDSQLKELFSQVGTVESATIIIDRETGQSKGFGFVEMSTEAEATEAVSKFNGYTLEGRGIVVNEARPQAPRSSFGNSRGFGGGWGGGRTDRRRF